MRLLRPVPLGPTFAAVLLTGVACHSSSSSSSSGAPTGAVGHFDLTSNPTPNFLDVPFPSDIYLQSGQVMTIPGVDALLTENSNFITHELAKMDGFSRIALSMFRVDDTTAPPDQDGTVGWAELDPTTFPVDETACVADTSSAFLIDLAPSDPTQARVICRAQIHQDYINPNTRPLAVVGPARGIVLAEGHPYAAVLTSRIKTTDGRNIQASADFQKVAKGDSSVPSVYTSAYATVATTLASALATDGAQIVALAPFTTNDMTKPLYALRDQLEAASAPALTFDAASMAPMQPAFFAQPVGGQLPSGFTASLDDWLGVVSAPALPDGSDDPDTSLPVRAHDKIAVVGTGVFQANNYLAGYTNGYKNLDDATFTYDSSGNIVPAPDAPKDSIWVSFAVPTATMPAAGYPVVIFQHGLSGSRDDLLDMANVFCDQGWMAVAIDSITFGARAPEAEWQVDKTSDFSAAPGATYKGPDGFGDASSAGLHNGSDDLFGNLLDLGAVRDQFRQAEIDTAQLVQVLRSGPSLAPLAWNGSTPKIDATRIAYVGQSLGAIEGAAAAAIEPHIQLWTLNVGGGGLITELATHGPVVGTLLSEAAGINFGVLEGTLDEGHPIVSLIEAVVEPGDPLALAQNIILTPHTLAGQATQPRDVLQFEVIYDEWVPNEADEALARAGGWGLAQPNVGSNSGILDYVNLANDPGRMPLPSVPAQSDGSFHDTPSQGVTAIVVQESPATHGDNMQSSTGQREYCIPFANFPTGTPFNLLDMSQYFNVPNPYRATQQTIVGFFTTGFAGGVPTVTVSASAAPTRNLDADPATDDVDPQPCNPKVY
jgi:dienelactone hydrolase